VNPKEGLGRDLGTYPGEGGGRQMYGSWGPAAGKSRSEIALPWAE